MLIFALSRGVRTKDLSPMDTNSNFDAPFATGDLLPPEGRPLILVVDDDEIFLDACTRLLAHMGFEVEQATDGGEVLKMAGQRDYRVILLDVKMPNLDGLSCLRQLKDAGCRADVVMVTGVNDIQTVVEAMKAGARDVITKPFRVTELVARIVELLKESDGDRASSSAGDRQRSEAPERRGRHSRYDDPLIAYIREHAVEINARQDVAAALDTTPELVSKRVHRATGLFFRPFLHVCRVDIARIMLETTDLSVAEVAERTGFSTAQHFSRVFRSVTNLSPRQYRQQL